MPFKWFSFHLDFLVLKLSLCYLHFHPFILPYFFIFHQRFVDLCPILSISLWFVSDLFPYGLSGEVKWRHGGVLLILMAALSSFYSAAFSYGIRFSHSPSAFAFHSNLPPLTEFNCHNFSPLVRLLLLYYSKQNWFAYFCSPYHFGSKRIIEQNTSVLLIIFFIM